MFGPDPVGPFQSWPADRQVSWLADEMSKYVDQPPPRPPVPNYVVAAWRDALADLAATIDSTSQPLVTPPMCFARSTMRGVDGHEKCDRPAGHKGECSWATEKYRRRSVEYEGDHRALLAERRKAARVEMQLRSTQLANERLVVLASKRRWGRKAKPDRG